MGHFGKEITITFVLSTFRQLHSKGSVGYTGATGDRAIEIINKGNIDLEEVITHRMPLSDWKKGFDLMQQRKAMKIL